jgi:hypothetical protein
MRQDLFFTSFFYFLFITNQLYGLNCGVSFNKDTFPIFNGLSLKFTHGNVSTSSKSVYKTLPDVEDLGLYRGMNVEFCFESKIKRNWEYLYGFPSYGIGFSALDFFSPKVIGYPISIYGFIKPRFLKSKAFSLNGDIALGLSFNWHHYSLLNPDNNAISLPRSVYINLGTSIKYLLTKNIALTLGGNVQHFSNGGTRRPNKGLNSYGLSYGINYIFNDFKNEYSKSNANSQLQENKNELTLSLHGGSQNFEIDSSVQIVDEKFEGINFLMWGVSATYQRQISRISKIGFGINVLDDGSVGSTLFIGGNEVKSQILPIIQRLKISFFPSYELVVGNLSFLLQPGIYIIKNKASTDVPVFYQRVGIKYYVSKQAFCGINLRSYNFNSANFIEYNIGYRI